MAEPQLAIVIPAYKARFLDETLESLCGQTNRRFRVYVGDDCSPEDIESICRGYADRLTLVYRRFDQNLGRESLVRQWNRCVELSCESWVWILGDDDVAEPECVEVFYQALAATVGRFPVYRFNTCIIDAESRIVQENPEHPILETGAAFAYRRLTGKCYNFLSECVFAREVYESSKGLIDFPLGWCSDDATWAAFSGGRGIFTLAGPRVLWRHSDLNITGSAGKYRDEKISAAFSYLEWLEVWLRKESQSGDDSVLERYLVAGQAWLWGQLQQVAPLGFRRCVTLAVTSARFYAGTPLSKLCRLFLIDFRHYQRRVTSLIKSLWKLRMSTKLV